MKKKKLEEEQVWQVPDKKWIRVRVILRIWGKVDMEYVELGADTSESITKKAFLRWIHRNKAKLIGIKDFETGKVRVVK